MHLLELIDDILDLARIEEGRLEITLADVDLAQLVQQTVRQLEGRAIGTGVLLGYTVPPDLAPVRADEGRLRQALINLLGNALKFTAKGTVHIEVETDPGGGGPRCLHGRDTGIGIPADRLSHVFQAFEQADGTTARRYGGAGLGLAISRLLCELMGFELSVASEPGRGSVFTVALHPGAAAGATAPAARPG